MGNPSSRQKSITVMVNRNVDHSVWMKMLGVRNLLASGSRNPSVVKYSW